MMREWDKKIIYDVNGGWKWIREMWMTFVVWTLKCNAIRERKGWRCRHFDRKGWEWKVINAIEIDFWCNNLLMGIKEKVWMKF